MARIVEPFIKAHVALWLVTKGANRVAVLIDGAEPKPSSAKSVLKAAGAKHQKNLKSKATWTGEYSLAQATITVVCKPGIDIDATDAQMTRSIVECKGEPTKKGTKAGRDRAAFHEAIGQLICQVASAKPGAGYCAVGLPDTSRIRTLVNGLKAKGPFATIGIKFLLVDCAGVVSEH